MNQLGKSDLYLNPVGIGCMSWGNPSHYKELLRKAVDAGLNFFDTADLYQRGLNEEYVGEALRPIRKQVVIATKVGNRWRPDGSGWDWNPRKAYILKSVEHSLRRLKTDYIDLYQLHGGTLEDPIDEVIEGFELLKAQGKIRWYGISSIRPEVIREYVNRSSIVSVMMQYSLLDQRPEEEVLDLLHTHGVSVIARGSMAKGLLVGKEPEQYLQFTDGEVAKVAKTVAKVARESGQHPLQVVLAYVLAHPSVAVSALGVRTLSQLDEVLSAKLGGFRLEEDQRRSLRKSVREFTYEAFR